MHRFPKAGFLLLAAFLSLAAAPVWDATPWLADLSELRAAVDSEYPNRDWLTGQREVSLDRWFDDAADAIRQSGGESGARKVLDRLVGRFNDGHFDLSWPEPAAVQTGVAPEPASPSPPSTVAAFCLARGYNARQVTAGTAAALPGYRPIDPGGPLAAGIARAGRTTIGIVRIGVFSPQGYPALCEQAAAGVAVAFDKPCDDACENRIMDKAYARLTRALMTAVERLRAAGAQVLLIDLTRNGGGSEWAEAAARIVSPVSLRSAPLRVVRSERRARRWSELATKLRSVAEGATLTDRALLAELADRADVLANGLMPCPGAVCSRLGEAGFASGLLPQLPEGQLRGRKWAADVFSPSQFPYRESVWKGPVIVLVDSETWSAAEQFTALLRDNDAAIVLGGRTGGAGCGHLDGNDPITLVHSKAVLEMPNCARFRRDGSNEVSGIVPDVLTGARWNDGAVYAGRLTAARLPEAIARANALLARTAH